MLSREAVVRRVTRLFRGERVTLGGAEQRAKSADPSYTLAIKQGIGM